MLEDENEMTAIIIAEDFKKQFSSLHLDQPIVILLFKKH